MKPLGVFFAALALAAQMPQYPNQKLVRKIELAIVTTCSLHRSAIPPCRAGLGDAQIGALAGATFLTWLSVPVFYTASLCWI
jgi:hypothetical protein